MLIGDSMQVHLYSVLEWQRGASLKATAGFCRDDCINIDSPVQSRLAVNRKRTALDTECLDTESSSDGQEGTCDLNHTMRELKALLLKQTPAHTNICTYTFEDFSLTFTVN